jgi:hypothetical protein
MGSTSSAVAGQSRKGSFIRNAAVEQLRSFDVEHLEAVAQDGSLRGGLRFAADVPRRGRPGSKPVLLSY